MYLVKNNFALRASYADYGYLIVNIKNMRV